MRVLITSFAHKTHFQGVVPLAWALRAAGHEVRVASQPALTDVILNAGLTAVPVGRDHALFDISADDASEVHRYSNGLDFNTRTELSDWSFLLEQNAALTKHVHSVVNNDSFLQELVEYARDWQPDLVLWEPFTYAGAIAARACGAAHARFLWGMDFSGYFRQEFRTRLAEQPEQERTDPFAHWLSETAARFGVDFTEELSFGQWVLAPQPASFRWSMGQTVVPMRCVPYNGPAVVPEWLRTGSASRVCVTGGSSGLGLSVGGDADSELAALADIDGEVVMTSDPAGRGTPRLPDNVRMVDFVPMHVLLANCAAVVHHGGAGTWSTAVHHGVPQIAIAHEWDAVFRSQHMAELGAGLYLPPEKTSFRDIVTAIRRVVDDPAFLDNARKLQAESFADPTPHAVVARLEELTIQRRVRSG